MNTVSRRFAIGSAIAAGAAVAATGSANAAPAAQQKSLGPVGENGRVYKLRSGKQEAVITGVAASLLSYKYSGQEILFTHDPLIMGEAGYQGKTILPWANRIKAGQYKFGGVSYQVPVNEVAKNTALHGLLNFVEWEPAAVGHDTLVLRYTEPPSYGYPFHIQYQIQYTLDNEGLNVTLSARNIGTLQAPLTTATHVYIAAPPGGHIDDLTLTLPASTYYLVDENLIPTGKAPVKGTQYDFTAPKKVGATKMDTAFTGVATTGGRSHATVARPGSVDVELWMDSAHTGYQVYTDDGPSVPREHRLGMALEPCVGAPNAFNTGDGLVTLDPGGSWSGSWGLRALG